MTPSGSFPTNRESQVQTVLKALGYTGSERVLDHYKVEISFHEALTSRLAIGKLTRGAVNQFAKLCADNTPAGLKPLLGPENKALAEEYVYGREFHDLITEFPGIITQPQQLFNVLARLTPRMYSIASAIEAHPGQVHTTVRVVRYHSHNEDRQGVCSGYMGERMPVGSLVPGLPAREQQLPPCPPTPTLPSSWSAPAPASHPSAPISSTARSWATRATTGSSSASSAPSPTISTKTSSKAWRRTASSPASAPPSHATSRRRSTYRTACASTQDLYEWLESGAYFYVCGDATRMAKDVETALLDIIAQGSNKTHRVRHRVPRRDEEGQALPARRLLSTKLKQ